MMQGPPYLDIYPAVLPNQSDTAALMKTTEAALMETTLLNDKS